MFSGILIAKRKLFTLKAPKACGGGTVNFVTRTSREYNYDIEIREEGGTPDIIGCIRAGLVFQLKDALDMKYVQTREDDLVKRFLKRFKKHERLIVLGSNSATRLPIFSFLVYIPSVGKYLHHNLVCLLLNDLFGIQVRSGCSCAGPYALDLLNVNDAKTDIYCLFMTEDVWYVKYSVHQSNFDISFSIQCSRRREHRSYYDDEVRNIRLIDKVLFLISN